MADTLESVPDSGHQSLPSEANIPAVALVDVQIVVNYIKRVIPALLEEDNVIHPSLEAALNSLYLTDKCDRFSFKGRLRRVCFN